MWRQKWTHLVIQFKLWKKRLQSPVIKKMRKNYLKVTVVPRTYSVDFAGSQQTVLQTRWSKVVAAAVESSSFTFNV